MAFLDVIVTGEWNGRPARYRSDQIIVCVLDTVSLRDVSDVIGAAIAVVRGSTIRSFRPGRRWAIVAIANVEAGQAARDVATRAGIRYAEPDFYMQAHWTTPNDLTTAQQWATTIHLEAAWKLLVDTWGKDVGSPDVMIAVLDSGIQMNSGAVDHPDYDVGRFILKHTLGGVDFLHDYATDPVAATPADRAGHGTEVTGVIAATTDNGQGLAGINWKSPIYIARVLDENADTCAGAVKEAMDDLRDYVEDVVCKRVIVNMSFGGTDPVEAESLRGIFEDFDDTRFLFCCAPAMNEEGEGRDRSYRADYPSRYAATYDNVISVGESDDSDAVTYPWSTWEVGDIRDITVVAPGDSAYTTFLEDPAAAAPISYDKIGGTSMACPMAAGIASLMWAESLWLTPAQIRSCLVDSATLLTLSGQEYHRVDAEAALLAVHADFKLETPNLAFVDVVEGSDKTLGVEMSAGGCARIRFRISQASIDALVGSGFEVVAAEMSYDPSSTGAVTGILVKYTAGAAGSVSARTLTLELVGSTKRWEVYLTANTAPSVEIAVVLVADTSGSMALPSGIGTKTRMDVMKDALKTAIDIVHPGSACGLVRFDTDAYVEEGLNAIASSDTGDASRVKLRNRVDGLAPAGSTSIGDGVKLGNDTAVADTTRDPAVLVLTDGHENMPEYIADVMSLITAPVYAIGMGTATTVATTALNALTAGNLLLTDTLDDETRYRLTKYCLQMLAQVASDSLILDPAGYVPPGVTIEIPFWITGNDRQCDVVLLLPLKNAIAIELATPAGRVIGPAASANVEFHTADLASFYRISLKDKLKGEGVGKWLARLSITDKQLSKFGKSGKKRERTRANAHGVPYDLLVFARSSLTMTVKSYATGFEPGSQVRLRAVLREAGQPPTKPAVVTARIHAPDGTTTNARLRPVGNGVYQYKFEAEMPGIYTSLVSAGGYNAGLQRYVREQTVTSHFWTESRATSLVAARVMTSVPKKSAKKF